MSKKTNRLRRRVQILTQLCGAAAKLSAADGKRQIADLTKKLANMELAANDLAKEVKEAREIMGNRKLDAFKVAIHNGPPFGRCGPIKQIAISWDPSMLRYGMMYSHRQMEPYALGEEIHFLIKELAYKIEVEIRKDLTEDPLLNPFGSKKHGG